MRTRDEITRLARDTGAAPGSPAEDMITETARRLSATERQIADKARHVRDALDGIGAQLGQAEPGLGHELAVLRHAPADLTLLLERHGVLAEQLAMILAATAQAAAGGTGASGLQTLTTPPGSDPPPATGQTP
jgi:hypothetical protein